MSTPANDVSCAVGDKRKRDEDPVMSSLAGPTPPTPSSALSSSTSFPAAPAAVIRIKSMGVVVVPSVAPSSPASVASQPLSTRSAGAPSPLIAAPPTAASVQSRSPGALSLSSLSSVKPSAMPSSPPLTSPQTPSAAPPAAAGRGLSSSQVEFARKLAKPLSEALMVGRAATEAAKVGDVALEIGQCLCIKPNATSQAKAIYLNLKEPKNTTLRDEIVAGQLSPQTLVDMDPLDLVNPEEKRKREEEYRERMRHRNWVELKRSLSSSTSLFKCPKCKSNDCNLVSHKQTRSGDEPMTARLQCNMCGLVFRREA